MSALRHLTLAAFLIGTCLFTAAAQAIETEEGTDGGRPVFMYGGACSLLAQLTRREIQAVTHSVHADAFDHFCFVEGIYSCSDYTALLRGAGALEDNRNYGCTFIPARR